MSRILMRVRIASLLLLAAAWPARADDDDGDFKGYQSRIEQSRKDYEKRYEQWRRDQDKRYQTWRDAPGADNDRELELPDSGLQPGRYTIRLPFGMGVRINAADGQPATAAGAWGDRSYGEVSYRAKQISGQLRSLHWELQRAGNAELTAEAARIYEQGASLANAAATRRPAEEIRGQFAKFDQLWHPFSHRFARLPDADAGVKQRVATINQLENGLHQILAISPAPPYDRPLVAALTSQLAQSTSHLVEDLKIEQQQAPELYPVTLRAQRVKQNAADLHETVRQNAPFAAIVEEYEEFDRAWHRLLEQTRGNSEIDAHLRQVSRQVRQIDQQLHDQLYVSAPVVDNRQQFRSLAAGIAKSADHLVRDLDADAGRDKAEMVEEARTFAWHAQALDRTLTSRQDPQAEQAALRDLVAAWQRLEARLSALRGERFEHSQEIAAQIGADLKRLQAQRG